jgi:Na+-transporting methylmalonyl-CoA/oxaloacetate decarboxylase gamma subunit
MIRIGRFGKSAQDTPGSAITAQIAAVAAVKSLLLILNMFVSLMGVLINRFAVCAASVL